MWFPTPTNESDGSSKERVEVAASSVNVGLQANPIPSFGQTTVEDSFPYHNLRRQEGVQMDSMGADELYVFSYVRMLSCSVVFGSSETPCTVAR